jgi:hypothetical protein
MGDQRLWQLEGDLRQAFENYNGGSMVSGPWEVLIESIAKAVDEAKLDLPTAAKLQLALERTQGGQAPDHCATCECPYPGQRHQ